MKAILLGFALALLANNSAQAAIYKFNDAFLRATPARVSAGYVYITNPTRQADILLRANFSVAGKTELHIITTKRAGVVEMQATKGINIGANCTTALRTGGWHIMLYDLRRPLKVGDTVKASLEFAKAGKKTVNFMVQPLTYPGAAAPTHPPLCQ
jgi:periplasmic copper chaperone A